MLSTTTMFRKLLRAPTPLFLMEAHSGLSAQIVERAGFQAIWASGLSLSASHAVRDSNELSTTQLLSTLEHMSDAVSIPILFDGDTGFGNYNTARRLVRKLEERRIAGVCFEDKLFPKTNSFVGSETQELADRVEHSNKLRACKEHQRDPNFTVVARLESLIVGSGLEDALRRAESYVEAGADAILVHSKQSTFDEIEEFCRHFRSINRSCLEVPLIVVPTKYYTTPTRTILDASVTNIIWANHTLRASIRAMESSAKQIYIDQSLQHIEHQVSPIETVFAYQRDSELQEDNAYYLQQTLCKPRVRPPPVRLVDPDVPSVQVDASRVREVLRQEGVSYTVGVPDSVLKAYFDPDHDSVACNEGVGLSMAAGYALETGRIPLVYLQNSGLGNLLNPLVSLSNLYKFPALLMIGWRGHDQQDEPQHNHQGLLTPGLLQLHAIPYRILDGRLLENQIRDLLAIARKEQKVVCLLVPPDSFLSPTRTPTPRIVSEHATTLDPNHVLATLLESLENSKIITSTGFNTRRCFSVLSRTPTPAKNTFLFCPGSMGHVLAVGIGVSAQTPARVVVVDGDGGLHMHSGTMTSLGHARNLTHLILDNACHESVGGQPTSGSSDVHICTLLRAYPYESVSVCTTLEDLRTCLQDTQIGRHAIVCPTHLVSTSGMGRPPMDHDACRDRVETWRKGAQNS